MTPEEFSQIVERCCAAGKSLAQAVAGADTQRIDAATQDLSLRVLEVQRAIPRALPGLQAAEPQVRQAWRERLAEAALPLKIGAELSTLNTVSASARYAALARISGAELSYSASGQLSR
ncbi:hypothetical protein [Pigmentiphaga sp. CHJ604]|uniref:hypothetical protein n=1 Tax=Pigmentiphaga sp. CHJ604 TaxID=3081984 RepID=UPI0030D39322